MVVCCDGFAIKLSMVIYKTPEKQNGCVVWCFPVIYLCDVLGGGRKFRWTTFLIVENLLEILLHNTYFPVKIFFL